MSNLSLLCYKILISMEIYAEVELSINISIVFCWLTCLLVKFVDARFCKVGFRSFLYTVSYWARMFFDRQQANTTPTIWKSVECYALKTSGMIMNRPEGLCKK